MSLEGAKFICLDEAGNHGEIVVARGRKFTMGYYMNCDYIISDKRAKGVHCEIVCDPFGRVTIRNFSPDKPILINGCPVEIKRILLNNSKLSILDKQYLWQFPKSSSNEFEDLPKDTISTPEKQIGIPEQPPNSCPDFKLHRELPKRFTVHNFAYCIQSDEEGNTSTDSNDENIEEYKEEDQDKIKDEVKVIKSNENQIDKDDNKNLKDGDNLKGGGNRSVTPEPQEEKKDNASALLETPKMNLINCTKDKENNSTHKTNKKQLLTLCNQSDVVITSFSPRETGVKIEKSFAAVIKPKVLVTKPPTTPKSVYSTPKAEIGDEEDDEKELINFHTPSTSKKEAVAGIATSKVLKNSSMHLIDLTTPNKLRPASPLVKSALKASTKKNLTQTSEKYSNKSPLEEQLGLSTLPLTPAGNDFNKGPLETPSSVISVSSTDTSSVVEVTSDGSNLGITSSITDGLTTPTKPQARAGACTPKRTPQSLVKRALLSSAKKQITTPQRGTTATNTPRRDPLNRIPLRNTLALQGSPVTPKVSTEAKSESHFSRRQSMSTPTRKSFSARNRFDNTPSTSISSPSGSTSLASRRSSLNPISSGRALPTSTPVASSSNSALHKVRKSVAGIPLPSHISKTRRSIALPASASKLSSVKEKSPQQVMSNRLVTRARKSYCVTPISARAQNMVAAAKAPPTCPSILKFSKLERKPAEQRKAVLFVDKLPSEGGELDDLSRTFVVDSDEEENIEKKDKPKDNTFSPNNPDKISDETDKASTTINTTFSPEKILENKEILKNVPEDLLKPLEIPLDVEEITEMQNVEIVNEQNNKSEITKKENKENANINGKELEINNEITKEINKDSESKESNNENNDYNIVQLAVDNKSESLVTEESFAEIINVTQENIEKNLPTNKVDDSIEIIDSPLDSNLKENEDYSADVKNVSQEGAEDNKINTTEISPQIKEITVKTLNKEAEVLETGFGEESLVEILDTSKKIKTTDSTETEDNAKSEQIVSTEKNELDEISNEKTKVNSNESIFKDTVVDDSKKEEVNVLDNSKIECKLKNYPKEESMEENINIGEIDSDEYKPIYEDITLEGSVIEKEAKEEESNQSKQPVYEDITLEGSVIEETDRSESNINNIKQNDNFQEILKDSEIVKQFEIKESKECLNDIEVNTVGEEETQLSKVEAKNNNDQEIVDTLKNSGTTDSQVVKRFGLKKGDESIKETEMGEEEEKEVSENIEQMSLNKSGINISENLNKPESDENTSKLLEEIEDVLNKSDEIKQKHLDEIQGQESENPLTDEFESEKLTQETNLSEVDKNQEIANLNEEKMEELEENQVESLNIEPAEGKEKTSDKSKDQEIDDNECKDVSQQSVADKNKKISTPKAIETIEEQKEEIIYDNGSEKQEEDVFNKSKTSDIKDNKVVSENMGEISTLAEIKTNKIVEERHQHMEESEDLEPHKSINEPHKSNKNAKEEQTDNLEASNNTQPEEHNKEIVENSATKDVNDFSKQSTESESKRNNQNEPLSQKDNVEICIAETMSNTTKNKDDIPSEISTEKKIEMVSSRTPRRVTRRASLSAETSATTEIILTPRRGTRRASQSTETSSTAESILTPRRNTRRTSVSTETFTIQTVETGLTPRRSTRRSSMSGEPTDTPTKKITRRTSISAISEAPLTPKRISSRRSSVDVDEEPSKILSEAKTPRPKTPRKLLEQRMAIPEDVADDMDAIIEEEEEPFVDKATSGEEKLDETSLETKETDTKDVEKEISLLPLQGDKEVERNFKNAVDQEVTKTSKALEDKKAEEEVIQPLEQSINVSEQELTETSKALKIKETKKKEEEEIVLQTLEDNIEEPTTNSPNVGDIFTHKAKKSVNILADSPKAPIMTGMRELLKTPRAEINTPQFVGNEEEETEKLAIVATLVKTPQATISQDLEENLEEIATTSTKSKKISISKSQVNTSKLVGLSSADNEEKIEKLAVVAELVKTPQVSQDLAEEDECKNSALDKISTPKSKKSVIMLADSPKTPIMTGMRELLKTPKADVNTPEFEGMRQLIQTPKSTLKAKEKDIKELTGVSNLLKTPQTAVEKNDGEAAEAPYSLESKEMETKEVEKETSEQTLQEDEDMERKFINAGDQEVAENPKPFEINGKKKVGDEKVEEEITSQTSNEDSEKPATTFTNVSEQELPETSKALKTKESKKKEEEKIVQQNLEDNIEETAVEDKKVVEEITSQTLEEESEEPATTSENVSEQGLTDTSKTLETNKKEEEKIVLQTFEDNIEETTTISTNVGGIFTPKAKKSVKILADSPKTPIMTGIRELLKTPGAEINTPKFVGIRNLLHTPKSTAENEEEEIDKLALVAELVKTPQATISQDLEEGLKEISTNSTKNTEISTPKTKKPVKFVTDSPKTTKITGMRELVKTPKTEVSTSKLKGLSSAEYKDEEVGKLGIVAELVKTPQATILQDIDDRDDIPTTSTGLSDISTPKEKKSVKNMIDSPKTPVMTGMRELLKTPKAEVNTPNLAGIGYLVRTPKSVEDNKEGETPQMSEEYEPTTSALDAEISTPKSKKSVIIVADSPKTPIMTGMRKLLKTPKANVNTPKYVGIRELVKTPKSTLESEEKEIEKLAGVADLVKTPQTTVVAQDLEEHILEEIPATSTKDVQLKGVKELLKTPKIFSTPGFKGMRELMQTPKMCSTPLMGGIKELMDTPVQQKRQVENDNLDKFLKTPTAKNIMIPSLPSSAIIEKSTNSIEVSLEYDLNATHEGESSNLEELFKTPVTSRFVERITASYYGDDDEERDETVEKFNKMETLQETLDKTAEEAFDKLVGQESQIQTPIRKTNPRKYLALQTPQAQSPFSAADVLSDLPKTDVEEWIETLDQAEPPTLLEGDDEEAVEKENANKNIQEVPEEYKDTCLEDSILDQDKNISKNECTIPETCAKVYLSEKNVSNVTTASEVMLNLSTVKKTSSKDPLASTSTKLKQKETRPASPIDAEISGIDLLDQTVESVQDEHSMLEEPLLVEEPSMFEEHLVVSDNDSEADIAVKNFKENKEEQKSLANDNDDDNDDEDANDLSEPLLVSDSEDLNLSQESQEKYLQNEDDVTSKDPLEFKQLKVEPETSSSDIKVEEKSILEEQSTEVYSTKDPLESQQAEALDEFETSRIDVIDSEASNMEELLNEESKGEYKSNIEEDFGIKFQNEEKTDTVIKEAPAEFSNDFENSVLQDSITQNEDVKTINNSQNEEKFTIEIEDSVIEGSFIEIKQPKTEINTTVESETETPDSEALEKTDDTTTEGSENQKGTEKYTDSEVLATLQDVSQKKDIYEEKNLEKEKSFEENDHKSAVDLENQHQISTKKSFDSETQLETEQYLESKIVATSSETEEKKDISKEIVNEMLEESKSEHILMDTSVTEISDDVDKSVKNSGSTQCMKSKSKGTNKEFDHECEDIFMDSSVTESSKIDDSFVDEATNDEKDVENESAMVEVTTKEKSSNDSEIELGSVEDKKANAEDAMQDDSKKTDEKMETNNTGILPTTEKITKKETTNETTETKKTIIKVSTSEGNKVDEVDNNIEKSTQKQENFAKKVEKKDWPKNQELIETCQAIEEPLEGVTKEEVESSNDSEIESGSVEDKKSNAEDAMQDVSKETDEKMETNSTGILPTTVKITKKETTNETSETKKTIIKVSTSEVNKIDEEDNNIKKSTQKQENFATKVEQKDSPKKQKLIETCQAIEEPLEDVIKEKVETEDLPESSATCQFIEGISEDEIIHETNLDVKSTTETISTDIIETGETISDITETDENLLEKIMESVEIVLPHVSEDNKEIKLVKQLQDVNYKAEPESTEIQPGKSAQLEEPTSIKEQPLIETQNEKTEIEKSDKIFINEQINISTSQEISSKDETAETLSESIKEKEPKTSTDDNGEIITTYDFEVKINDTKHRNQIETPSGSVEIQTEKTTTKRGRGRKGSQSSECSNADLEFLATRRGRKNTNSEESLQTIVQSAEEIQQPAIKSDRRKPTAFESSQGSLHEDESSATTMRKGKIQMAPVEEVVLEKIVESEEHAVLSTVLPPESNEDVKAVELAVFQDSSKMEATEIQYLEEKHDIQCETIGESKKENEKHGRRKRTASDSSQGSIHDDDSNASARRGRRKVQKPPVEEPVAEENTTNEELPTDSNEPPTKDHPTVSSEEGNKEISCQKESETSLTEKVKEKEDPALIGKDDKQVSEVSEESEVQTEIEEKEPAVKRGRRKPTVSESSQGSVVEDDSSTRRGRRKVQKTAVEITRDVENSKSIETAEKKEQIKSPKETILRQNEDKEMPAISSQEDDKIKYSENYEIVSKNMEARQNLAKGLTEIVEESQELGGKRGSCKPSVSESSQGSTHDDTTNTRRVRRKVQKPTVAETLVEEIPENQELITISNTPSTVKEEQIKPSDEPEAMPVEQNQEIKQHVTDKEKHVEPTEDKLNETTEPLESSTKRVKIPLEENSENIETAEQRDQINTSEETVVGQKEDKEMLTIPPQADDKIECSESSENNEIILQNVEVKENLTEGPSEIAEEPQELVPKRSRRKPTVSESSQGSTHADDTTNTRRARRKVQKAPIEEPLVEEIHENLELPTISNTSFTVNEEQVKLSDTSEAMSVEQKQEIEQSSTDLSKKEEPTKSLELVEVIERNSKNISKETEVENENKEQMVKRSRRTPIASDSYNSNSNCPSQKGHRKIQKTLDILEKEEFPTTSKSDKEEQIKLTEDNPNKTSEPVEEQPCKRGRRKATVSESSQGSVHEKTSDRKGRRKAQIIPVEEILVEKANENENLPSVTVDVTKIDVIRDVKTTETNEVKETERTEMDINETELSYVKETKISELEGKETAKQERHSENEQTSEQVMDESSDKPTEDNISNSAHTTKHVECRKVSDTDAQTKELSANTIPIVTSMEKELKKTEMFAVANDDHKGVHTAKRGGRRKATVSESSDAEVLTSRSRSRKKPITEAVATSNINELPIVAEEPIVEVILTETTKKVSTSVAQVDKIVISDDNIKSNESPSGIDQHKFGEVHTVENIKEEEKLTKKRGKRTRTTSDSSQGSVADEETTKRRARHRKQMPEIEEAVIEEPEVKETNSREEKPTEVLSSVNELETSTSNCKNQYDDEEIKQQTETEDKIMRSTTEEEVPKKLQKSSRRRGAATHKDHVEHQEELPTKSRKVRGKPDEKQLIEEVLEESKNNELPNVSITAVNVELDDDHTSTAEKDKEARGTRGHKHVVAEDHHEEETIPATKRRAAAKYITLDQEESGSVGKRRVGRRNQEQEEQEADVSQAETVRTESGEPSSKRRAGQRKQNHDQEEHNDHDTHATAEDIKHYESAEPAKKGRVRKKKDEIETHVTADDSDHHEDESAETATSKRRAGRRKQNHDQEEHNDHHTHATAEDIKHYESAETAKKGRVRRKKDVLETHVTADDSDHHEDESLETASHAETKKGRTRRKKDELQTEIHVTAKDSEQHKEKSAEVAANEENKKGRGLRKKDEYPVESERPTTSSQSRGRKRKQSHTDNEDQHSDEIATKSPETNVKKLKAETASQTPQRSAAATRRGRKASAIDVDKNVHNVVENSDDSPSKRPLRKAATAYHNYDETSDSDKPTKKKTDSPRKSLDAAKSTPVTVTSASVTDPSPSSFTPSATTARGRTRKPTAKVQQLLEEERAKAETPRKRGLLAVATAGTPTPQRMPGRRGRKASTIETDIDAVGTPQAIKRGRGKAAVHNEDHKETAKVIESTDHTTPPATTSAKGRRGGRKAKTSAEDNHHDEDEPPAKKSPLILEAEKQETSPEVDSSTPIRTTGKRNAAAAAKARIEEDALAAAAIDIPKRAKAKKIPTAKAGADTEGHSSDREDQSKTKSVKGTKNKSSSPQKREHRLISASTVEGAEDLNTEENESDIISKPAVKRGARRVAASATTDSPAAPAKRGRKVNTESNEAESADVEPQTTRGTGRGRKNAQLDAETSTEQKATSVKEKELHVTSEQAAEETAAPVKRSARTRRK